MGSDFDAAYATLRTVFAAELRHLDVASDTAANYSLNTLVASPFPQHKGGPMWFGSVCRGKAYVSFHLMPLYMNDALTRTISPELKKRMQGKTCFNFKAPPDPALLEELKELTKAGLKAFQSKGWA